MPALLFVRRVIDGVVRSYERDAPDANGSTWQWLCGPYFCTFNRTSAGAIVVRCPCDREQRGPSDAGAYYR